MKNFKIKIRVEGGAILESEIEGTNETEAIKELLKPQFNMFKGNPSITFNRDKIITVESEELK